MHVAFIIIEFASVIVRIKDGKRFVVVQKGCTFMKIEHTDKNSILKEENIRDRNVKVRFVSISCFVYCV